MSQRILRINQLLKKEISQLLVKEVNFHNALVTITQVKTSQDLSHARVKISVLPQEKSQQVMEIIRRNIFALQQILNKKLNLRIVPKMVFEIDQSEIKAQRIEEILKNS